MINFYNEDEVRNLKKRNKNNLVIIVILNIVSFIVLLLSFIFIKLNVALFEMAAKEWKESNLNLKENIRDYTDLKHLLILGNIQK